MVQTEDEYQSQTAQETEQLTLDQINKRHQGGYEDWVDVEEKADENTETDVLAELEQSMGEDVDPDAYAEREPGEVPTPEDINESHSYGGIEPSGPVDAAAITSPFSMLGSLAAPAVAASAGLGPVGIIGLPATMFGAGMTGAMYVQQKESEAEAKEERLRSFRYLEDPDPEKVADIIGRSDEEGGKVGELMGDAYTGVSDPETAKRDYLDLIRDGKAEYLLSVDEETGEYELWVMMDWYEHEPLDDLSDDEEPDTYGKKQPFAFTGVNRDAVDLYQEGDSAMRYIEKEKEER
jgi:hypothetical protein